VMSVDVLFDLHRDLVDRGRQLQDLLRDLDEKSVLLLLRLDELWDGNKRSATPSGFRDPFIANLTDARNIASASSHPDYWSTVSS
jgi:hypothetical protein